MVAETVRILYIPGPDGPVCLFIPSIPQTERVEDNQVEAGDQIHTGQLEVVRNTQYSGDDFAEEQDMQMEEIEE